MKAEQPINPENQESRIVHLQKIIEDEKHIILQRAKKVFDDLLVSKKYKEFKQQLRERIQKTDKFIKHISETFFTMLSDCQFLSLTTQIQLIQKIQKFKKNLFNSLQKMTVNLDGRSKRDKKGYNNQSQINQQEDQGEMDEPSIKNSKQRRQKKSKNSKMSSQTSMRMMQWLLRNFENPYPSTQQKEKMSQQSNINVTQVNNWFINARQRTIKSYFIKDI